MLVLLFHLSGFVPAPRIFRGGFLGVDVFFVMSGYLITTLLVKEFEETGGVGFRNFYVRRALRLLPALGVALVLGFLVVSWAHPPLHVPFWKMALILMTYVGNWLTPLYTLPIFNHTWSLAIEEQYYLVWPALLVFLMRRVRSRVTLASMVLAGAVASALLRYVVFEHWSFDLAYRSTLTRADGVLAGSALALALSGQVPRLRQLLQKPLLGAIGVFGVVVGIVTLQARTAPTFQGGMLAVNLFATAMLGHLVVNRSSPFSRFLSRQPLVFIGRISYGLYVFQVMLIVLVFAGHPERRTGIAWPIATVVLIFAVSAASFLLIEQRALRLKARFGTRSRISESDGGVVT